LTIHCDFGKGAIKALKAMSFPFFMLGDIDEVWEEMIECKSKLRGIDDDKVSEFNAFKSANLFYFGYVWLR
jgi:hypothetical protein